MNTLKFNKLCPLCFKNAWGIGLMPQGFGSGAQSGAQSRDGVQAHYEIKKFCSLKHLNVWVTMKNQKINIDEEDLALFEAAKAGGTYLDQLNVYDLRYLNKGQLILFISVIISKFAEHKPRHFDNKNELIQVLTDEIPF